MNINDVDKFKENLEKKTTRGFGYFMKNIGMVLLVFISIFILTNPTCITDPVSFFGTFKIDGLWVVLVLFASIAGFYQLSKSVQREDRASRKEQRIGEYEEAIPRKAEEVRKEHSTSVYFRDEEKCQEYCDYLSKLNGVTEDMTEHKRRTALLK